MKLAELREKTELELNKLLAAERERLRDMRFKVSIGQLKQVRLIRVSRQLISRILTELKVRTQAK